jgi:hypothetical protein
MAGPNADEVRLEAYRAAAAAVDHFLERAGQSVPRRLNDLGAATWERFQSELARVVDLNLEVVRNAFGLYGDLLGPGLLEQKANKLVFGPGVAGSESVAVVWLHNFEAEPMTSVSLVGSRLSGREGQRIDEATWSFRPAPVSVPSRTAVPVLVTLGIPPGADTGSYTGSISTAGRPGEPVEVHVDVIAMEPIAHDSW